jgi:hypothetical protein
MPSSAKKLGFKVFCILLILCVFLYMLKVFPLYIRRGNNRGIVCRGIIKDYKVVIEFSLVINNM